MRSFILLLFISLPCMAQMDRDTFFATLDQGEAQLIQRIDRECVGFSATATDVERLGFRPAVLEAWLRCLHMRTSLKPATATAPVVAAQPAESVAVTAPTTSTRPEPVSVTPTAQPTATAPTPGNQAQFYTAKLAEALNTLSLSSNMKNRAERLRMRMDALPLVANLVREQGWMIEANGLQSTLLEGFKAPQWVVDDLGKAKDGRDKGYPTLGFNFHKNVLFDGGRGKKGAQVFLGLYRLDPQAGDAVRLEDHLIYSHQAFPITYDRNSDTFQYFKVPNRGMDLSLAKKLNKSEPLTLFPGDWVLEIIFKDGQDRLRSRDKIRFQVENGGTYTLNVKMETDRRGVRQLKGTLR